MEDIIHRPHMSIRMRGRVLRAIISGQTGGSSPNDKNKMIFRLLKYIFDIQFTLIILIYEKILSLCNLVVFNKLKIYIIIYDNEI